MAGPQTLFGHGCSRVTSPGSRWMPLGGSVREPNCVAIHDGSPEMGHGWLAWPQACTKSSPT